LADVFDAPVPFSMLCVASLLCMRAMVLFNVSQNSHCYCF
jgi:hypothetical protein